jgi:hypothetical protein
MEGINMFYILLFGTIIVLAASPWLINWMGEKADLARRRDQAIAIARSGRGRPLSQDEFFSYYQNAILVAWWDAERVVRIGRGGIVVHRQLAADAYGFLRMTLPKGGFVDLEVQLKILDLLKKEASFIRASVNPLSAGRTELISSRRRATARN